MTSRKKEKEVDDCASMKATPSSVRTNEIIQATLIKYP